jgi:6-phosphogluconolactonase (cycloisomerase 2 family)
MGNHATSQPTAVPGRRAARAVRCAVATIVALAAVAGLGVRPPAGASDQRQPQSQRQTQPRQSQSQAVSEAFARPLYVTNSDNEDPADQDDAQSNVTQFAIASGGRLTPGATVDAPFGARAMVFTPDLRHAYVANGQSNTISQYSIGPGGRLDLVDDVPTDLNAGLAITPDGRTVYVLNTVTNTLSVFGVEPTGRLDARGSVDAGGATPKDLVVTPDGRFLYVTHGMPPGGPVTSVVTGFAIGPDGMPGPKVADGGPGTGEGVSGHEISMTPDGRFVYVVHTASDQILGYRVGADGSLTQVVRQPTDDFPEGIAVSPDGRSLYAGLFGDPLVPGARSALLGFAVGAGGQLTPTTEVDMSTPIGIAFAPDGRHLYVTSYRTSEVTAFRVDPAGGVTRLQTLPSGGLQPAFHSASVLPNRGPVASFTVRPGRAGVATRFDAAASSDPDGQVARYDWDFGDGTRLPDGGPAPRHVYRAPGTYRVQLTVTDDERCSTRLVYTGQKALCLGSPAATATRTVTVTP